MMKEGNNHRNAFLMKKPSLLLTQFTRNHEFAVGEKLTSFDRVNTSLLIGGIKRKKQNTFITQRLPLFVWLVLICSEKKVLLAGFF
jgi:hypothetical protein